jgi:hypothetical protein
MNPSDPQTLETTGIKTPDLQKIILEVQQAQSDSNRYGLRMNQVRSWWMCEWPNQTDDGRRWSPDGSKGRVFPWDGCSDSRLRIVSTIIQEHVTLCLAAFWSAKKQAKSIRPFVSGREVNITQNMLDWRVGTQMKRELLRELPMALQWRFGGGLSFIKIEWEQQRELAYVPITVQMIGEISSAMGLPDVTEKLLDPDKFYDAELVKEMQKLSPVLPTAEARTVLSELRATGQSQLPVASMRVNKPKWTARRPIIDVLFPSQTVDIQQTRFTCERELVSETELTDRIVTDGYDDIFVEEALKHKGEFAGWWLHRLGTPDTSAGTYIGSDRDMVELNHVLSWRLSHNGTPCLYRTVFNQSTAALDKGAYAVHRKFEYEHGQIPLVALRRNYTWRPLLLSIGIAEEAYTDELDIKVQQDGLNNRTELIHQPPMIVPTLRAQAVAQTYGPRSVMTAMRPESVVFPPLPPMDQTPMMVIEMVQNRLDRRYAITGGNVDPQIIALRRQQLSNEVLGEFELCLEQTLQLMQQYETDQDVQRVAGGGQPWQFSAKDIQGQYDVSAAVDINNIDIERAGQKLDMLAKMLPFKQAGGMVFKAAAQIVDPDLADALAQDEMSPQAMEKERSDEYNAVSQIMSGIEPVQNLMANAQFRLQVLQQIMQQPQFQQELAQKPISQKLLQNRVQAYMAQIQQFQQNPQIGRSLSTQTFSPTQAPNQASAPAQ